jgi:hypothetical protein
LASSWAEGVWFVVVSWEGAAAGAEADQRQRHRQADVNAMASEVGAARFIFFTGGNRENGEGQIEMTKDE